MSATAHLTSAPAAPPVDVRDLDVAAAHLRRVERVAGELRSTVTTARDGLVASPADPEMQRSARMAALQMRATLTMLADFAA